MDTYISNLRTAAMTATPSNHARSQRPNLVSYPLEIRQLVAEKRYARRQWKNTRNPANKKMLQQALQETQE